MDLALAGVIIGAVGPAALAVGWWVRHRQREIGALICKFLEPQPSQSASVQQIQAALDAKYPSSPSAEDALARLQTQNRVVRTTDGAWRLHVTSPPVTTQSFAPPDTRHYLTQLRNLTGYIDVRGLAVGGVKAHRFPIEDLYVALTTRDLARGPAPGERESREVLGGEELREIELKEALIERKLAIVGDPGSGKTTFLNRIAHALAQTLLGDEPAAAQDRLGISGQPFPILIDVADLVEHIKAREREPAPGKPTLGHSPRWVFDFLDARNAGLGWRLPEGFFQDQLQDGATTFLLDGLDEAPDEATRERIARLFESAVSAFENCRFVVTCRTRAYRGDAVLAGFHRVEIAPFDQKAIEKFLGHWCSGLFPKGPDQAGAHRAELIKSFQVPEIRRMASNPVMLTALAVVHWNEHQLPEQRAELYESVIQWLLKSRKTGKDRANVPTSEKRLRRLAFRMQDNQPEREVKVTRHWAAEAIQDMFAAEPQEDRIEQAKTYLGQEEIDSGVIKSSGDSLEFWHLTFQEFLAAKEIAGQSDSRQTDILFANDKLYRSEWREVFRLYAGVLCGQGHPKVDSLFETALGKLGDNASLAWRARCVGLLGAAVRDLAPSDYQPAQSYHRALRAVLAIFEPGTSADVPFQDRLDAAEALGRAGDPRFDQPEENWVRIDPGSFLMGSDAEDARDREKPPHEVYLDAFEIGRYTVTMQEFSKFVEDGGYREPRWWHHGDPPEDLPQVPDAWDIPNVPMVRVSWFDACAYCEWLSERTSRQVRLPTEAEWERAASNGDGRKYPWGAKEPDSTRANYRYDGSPGRPTPVGLHPAGGTPAGLQDMAGNVWEWCRDWYSRNYYGSSPEKNPRGPKSGHSRVIRGGAWINYRDDAACSGRSIERPNFRNYFIGFRCARTSE